MLAVALDLKKAWDIWRCDGAHAHWEDFCHVMDALIAKLP
jgi:hypothetical protein